MGSKQANRYMNKTVWSAVGAGKTIQWGEEMGVRQCFSRELWGDLGAEHRGLQGRNTYFSHIKKKFFFKE